MSNYLKLFTTHSEYQTYISGDDVLKPNVSYCEDNNQVHYNPLVPPQPIAPIGKVQVFANPQCTEYADGYCKDVWVRFNQDFGYNDSHSWGNPQQHGTYLVIYTPTDEYPQDVYGIGLWNEWGDDGSLTGPFVSGQIVKCSFLMFGEPILDNVQVIFEQTTNKNTYKG